MSTKPYNLFLDDLRSVEEAYRQEKHEMFLHKEWIIVRSYDEFVSYIHRNGLPELISFDHDLDETHYTPKEYWLDYKASEAYQDAQTYKIKTGLDAANFVIDYCNEYKKDMPKTYSHSANPIGRDRINEVIHKYRRLSGDHNRFDTNVRLKKTLMYCSQYVDVNLLFSGIYCTDIPHLYAYDATIESIIERHESSIASFNQSSMLTTFINNIKQCKLIDIELSVKL